MNALTCTDVSIRRGDREVVHGASLSLERGGWLALVGPNGAGKSSLLLALAGLLPAAGTIDVAGLDPAHASRRELARAVALMPQQPVLPEGISVGQLVALGRAPYQRLLRGETAADHDAIDRALTRLDLDDLVERPATSLSGGELQRVVLARALAQEPQVLLLDEPTSSLDIGHQQTVLELVDDLRRHDGLTVVAAMHDLTLAGQYSTRMALLSEGRVVANAPAAAVLQADLLHQVYGARVEVLDRASGPAVIPDRPPLPPPGRGRTSSPGETWLGPR